jgi:hypothetical protein
VKGEEITVKSGVGERRILTLATIDISHFAVEV